MNIVRHPLGRLRDRLATAAAADRVLAPLGLDVVHDMGTGCRCDLVESHDGSRFAQWEQKLLTLPRVARPVKRLLLATMPRYRKFRRVMERQFADRGQLVLALSQMVARDYERYHQIPRERIRLVYNGVDTERFSPDHRGAHRETVRRRLGVGPDEVLFLFVGHDFRRKGLVPAMRAMGRLVRAGRPVRLAVVGGRERNIRRHEAYCRRHGLAGAVRFAGRIDDSVPYYAAGDVYVLPTFYDPCSLGVLEAVASGLPSITTRFNGAGEMLSDGRDGYVLADPADDAALAARMEELLDPAMRARMGEAARRLALEHTLQRNCDQIEALYHEIVGRRRQAA
jgi:UDP-glucose:(heptosyl)LPS alpha-1,3-glucosyltransferase